MGSATLYEASENKTVSTRDEEKINPGLPVEWTVLKVLTADEDNIKPGLLVDRVVVEGCGCFNLHTNKKGRGKMTLLQAGETIMEGQLKVRSVRKVDCDRYRDV